jgi:hypothetical protein
VDHQVEDDVDVQAALGKGREPVDLDELGIGDVRERRFDGRIEPLGVPHREDRAAGACRGNHAIGFRDRPRHRFFDEHADSAREQGLGNREMILGRHGNAHRVEIHAGELADVGADEGARRLRVFRRADGVAIDDRGERHARRRTENAGVMASEMADADDRGAQAHGRALPITAMPASLADARNASRSKISALPASSDSAVPPAARIA